MHILISNDDGYLAPGLRCLHRVVLERFQEQSKVSVLAPDSDRSAASHSLTLQNPLRVTCREPDIYSVAGTPTDCVHLAVNGFFDTEPDVVISGINSAPNMGDDVLYSGTVAAAMEARHLGRPSIAISMGDSNPTHYETAARIAVRLVMQLYQHPLPPEMILNVNVPDLPLDQIRGTKITRLGRRHRSESVVRQQDPRGETVFWIGPPGKTQDAGADTDFYAVSHGYVSVTPLHIDLTDYQQISNTKAWLSDVDEY